MSGEGAAAVRVADLDPAGRIAVLAYRHWCEAGPGAVAAALGAEGRTAVYKMGAEGSETFAQGESVTCGIFAVEAIKPMGAGDAFMAGLVAALAAGRPLSSALREGSAAAAIVVSGIGCAPSMPDRAGLDAFIARHPGMGRC